MQFKKTYKDSTGTWIGVQRHLPSGKCKLKPQCDKLHPCQNGYHYNSITVSARKISQSETDKYCTVSFTCGI